MRFAVTPTAAAAASLGIGVAGAPGAPSIDQPVIDRGHDKGSITRVYDDGVVHATTTKRDGSVRDVMTGYSLGCEKYEGRRNLECATTSVLHVSAPTAKKGGGTPSSKRWKLRRWSTQTRSNSPTMWSFRTYGEFWYDGTRIKNGYLLCGEGDGIFFTPENERCQRRSLKRGAVDNIDRSRVSSFGIDTIHVGTTRTWGNGKIERFHTHP